MTTKIETIDSRYRKADALLNPFPERDAQFQTSWAWMTAIYLFLGGVGSGAYVIGAIAGFVGWPTLAKVGLGISFPIVAVGTMFLLAHLGKPFHSVYAASKPGTSWIARGVICITLFMAFAVVHFALTVWPLSAVGAKLGGLLSVWAALGILFALGTMAYTGALLSAAKGVPVWRTGIMPILFLFSGLVTGLFAVLLVAGPTYDVSVARKLAMTGAGLILIEGIVIFFFLHSGYRLPESRGATTAMMKSSKFLIGDLLVGLAVPFLAMLVVLLTGTAKFHLFFIVAGICALVGGLLLRFMVLSSGRISTLRAGGWEFKLEGGPYKAPPMHSVPPGNL